MCWSFKAGADVWFSLSERWGVWDCTEWMRSSVEEHQLHSHLPPLPQVSPTQIRLTAKNVGGFLPCWLSWLAKANTRNSLGRIQFKTVAEDLLKEEIILWDNEDPLKNFPSGSAFFSCRLQIFSPLSVFCFSAWGANRESTENKAVLSISRLRRWTLIKGQKTDI